MARKYTVAEFRMNMKQAFDQVLARETVIIVRGGVEFHLNAMIRVIDPTRPTEFNSLPDDGESHDIRPDLPKGGPLIDHYPTTAPENLSEKFKTGADAPEAVKKLTTDPLPENIRPKLEERGKEIGTRFCKHGAAIGLCKHGCTK